MNHGYSKLFSTILTSSIWSEDDRTRLLWITMLALCDARGEVGASVGGLAHAARISREDCERGLAVLLSPDTDSRSKEFEGRRIEAVDGGWRILNYASYRERGRSVDRTAYLAEKQRESRARRKPKKYDVLGRPSNGRETMTPRPPYAV